MDEFERTRPTTSDGVIVTKSIWAAKPFLVAYVVAIGFTVGMLVNRTPGGSPAVPVLAGGHQAAQSDEGEVREDPLWMQIFRPSQATARQMLRFALPMLTTADPAAQENRSLVVYWVGQGQEKPQTLFQTVLPFLHSDPGPQTADVTPPPPDAPDSAAGTQPDAPAQPPAGPPAGADKPPEQPVNGGLPLVGIYHTHDWETYISEFSAMPVTSQGDLNKIVSYDHKKRTVVDLGRTLAQDLKQFGVVPVHADGTHQSLGYDYAYDASRVTAKRILSEHPSVKILLDLHRDGTYGQTTTKVIAGQKVAQVRCIIGIVDEPHWQQNQAFCSKVLARLEKDAPGITLETRRQKYQYNQDLIPGAVLFEIGGAMNQYAEAERAIGYLARAISEVVRAGDYPH